MTRPTNPADSWLNSALRLNPFQDDGERRPGEAWLSSALQLKPTREVRFTEVGRPETDLYFGGFEAEVRQPTSVWERVVKGATSVLSALEPLLFVGDVAKAAIYGAATGGASRALELARQQASAWRDYLPFGKTPKPVVTGDDLMRVLDPKYEERPAWQRVGMAFAAEILTDPLSVFGIVGMAAKGGAVAARGAAALTRRVAGEAAAAPATLFGRALDVASKAAFAADRAANLAFNPYAQAFYGTRALGRARLNDEGLRVAQVAGRVLDGILDMPIASSFRGYALRLRHVAPGWLGSPDVGPGVRLTARAAEMQFAEAVASHVEDLQRILHDGLGEPVRFFGLFERRVIPERYLPLEQEIRASVYRVLDNAGVANEVEALRKQEGLIRRMARSVGFDEGRAIDTYYRFFERARQAFTDISYRMTGFELYRDVWKGVAKEFGVDPEAAWQRYSAWRTANSGKAFVVERVDDALRFRETSPLIFKAAPDIEKVVPAREIAKLSEAAASVVERGADAALLRRLAPLLSPDQIARLPDNLVEAARVPRAVVQEAQVLGNITRVVDGLNDLVGKLFGGGAATAEVQKAAKAATNLLLEGDVASWWEQVDRISRGATADYILRLIKSASPERRTAGYAALSLALERSGDEVGALVALGLAAKEAPNPVLARAMYEVGAPPVYGVKVPTAIDLRDVGEIVGIIKGADRLDFDGVAVVANALTRLPKVIADDILRAIEGVETPLARLARAIASRDRGELVDIFVRAVSGEIPATGGGVSALARLGKPLGLEEMMANALRERGLGPGDLPAFRASFEEVLAQIEDKALERFFALRPNYGGAKTHKDLFIPKGAAKYEINPFSPLALFEMIRQGYARRAYLGVISPKAAEAALLKGRLALVPEIDPEKAAGRMQATLKELGLEGRSLDAAVKDMMDYFTATEGRYVYTAETVLRLLQDDGVQLDQQGFVRFMNAVFGSDGLKDEALEVLAKIKGEQEIARATIRLHPERFQARLPQEQTKYLMEVYDPVASLAELGRMATREVFTQTLLNEAYRVLKEANLIFDYNPGPGFARVPETTVKVRGGAEELFAYGPLAGKYIPEHYLKDLARTLAIDPISHGAWGSFLTFWRKALLNSPVTTMVNAIGNLYLTWAFDPKLAVEAVGQLPRAAKILDDYYRTGKLPKDMEGVLYFLRETSLSAEMRKAVADSYIRIARENPEVYNRGIVERAIEKIDAYANDFGSVIAKAIGKEKNEYIKLLSPVHAFGYVENLQRVANYLAARKMGLDPTKALWVASEATFNYANVPYAIDMIRRYGVMAFPSFTYFMLRSGAKWAVERPAALTIPQRFAQASWYAGTDSPEDHARLMVYMPDWLRGTLPAVLPIRGRNDEYIVAPLSYLLPMPTLSGSVLTEALSFGVLQPFIDVANGIMRYIEDPVARGTPVLASRYGETLYRPAATPKEAITDMASYLVEKFMPQYAVRVLPIADMPELIAAHFSEADKSGLYNLKSIFGRLYAQYTHPAAVQAIEQMTGRAIGLTPEEALGAFFRGRRLSTDPAGVSSVQGLRSLEDFDSKVKQMAYSRLVRGDDPKNIARDIEKLMGRAKKMIEPYLELNRVFGPTP